MSARTKPTNSSSSARRKKRQLRREVEEEEAKLSLSLSKRSLKLLKRIFPWGKTQQNKREHHAHKHIDVHLSKTRGRSLREILLLLLLFEYYRVSSNDFFVFFFFMGRTGLFRRQIVVGVVVVVIVWKNVYYDCCCCGCERSASYSSSSVFRTTTAKDATYATKAKINIHPNAIDAKSILFDVSAWKTGSGGKIFLDELFVA